MVIPTSKHFVPVMLAFLVVFAWVVRGRTYAEEYAFWMSLSTGLYGSLSWVAEKWGHVHVFGRRGW